MLRNLAVWPDRMAEERRECPETGEKGGRENRDAKY